MVSTRLRQSIALALLFFVISSPYTYKVVDQIVGTIVGSTVPQLSWALRIAEGGCPTTYGLAVHAVVFGAVAYMLKQ
jgi:hypothetical protein